MKKKILALMLSFSTIFSVVSSSNLTVFAKEANVSQTAATAAENLTVTAVYPKNEGETGWYKDHKRPNGTLYGYTEFCLRYQEESLPFPCLSFYSTYYQFDVSHPISYNYVPTDIGTVITRHLTDDMADSTYTITMHSAKGNVNPCYTDTGVPYIRNFDIVDCEGVKAHFYWGAIDLPGYEEAYEGVSYWYVPELDMSYGLTMIAKEDWDADYFYFDTLFAVDGCYNPVPDLHAINGIPAKVDFTQYFPDFFEAY